jgi:hypothetical protein
MKSVSYSEDIQCVYRSADGEKAIYISNIEAAQNPRILRSRFILI